MTSHRPIPWKLYSVTGPRPEILSAVQVKEFCDRFGFEAGQLVELGRKLALALKPALNISQPELVGAKRDRGGKEALRAIEDLEKAEKAIAKARETVSQLKFLHPYAHTGMPNPAEQHLAAFKAAAQAVSDFRRYLQIMQRENDVSYSAVPDRRKVRDVRREIVCWTIFGFWDEAGRPVTFTTDPITSERTGELFDFVKAVVAVMTDPSTVISGETIKLERERWLAFRDQGQV